MGGTIDQGHPDPSQRELFDPEIMKYVLDDMMEEAGVEVLLNTFTFDVVVEDNVLKGVATANKSGGQVIMADVVVDTSGDADIAAAAGVPFDIGREKDGRLNGGSLMMDIGGVDVRKYAAYFKNRPERTDRAKEKAGRGSGAAFGRWWNSRHRIEPGRKKRLVQYGWTTHKHLLG